MSCASTLCCVLAGGYPSKEFGEKGQSERGSCQCRRAYKAKVASLTSELAKLRARMKNMMEEAVKLKSDLRHTSTVLAWAEGKEEKAREGLRVAEGECFIYFIC